MKKHIKSIKGKKQTPPPSMQKDKHNDLKHPQKNKAEEREDGKAEKEYKKAEKELELLTKRYEQFVKLKKHRNAYTVSLEMSKKTEKVMGLMNINTALMYFQTANIAFFLKEYKLATQHYEKLITIIENIPTDKRLKHANIYNYTAQAFDHINQIEPSIAYYIKSIAALRKQKNHDKERLCTMHAKIAELHYLNKKYPDAILFFKKALNIYKKYSEEMPSFVHICNQTIGVCYFNMDNINAALKHYQEAFTALEAKKETHYLEQGNLAHCIADCYMMKKKYTDTLDWYKTELLIYKKNIPQNKIVITSLINLYKTIWNITENTAPKINLLPYKKFLKTHFSEYL